MEVFMKIYRKIGLITLLSTAIFQAQAVDFNKLVNIKEVNPVTITLTAAGIYCGEALFRQLTFSALQKLNNFFPKVEIKDRVDFKDLNKDPIKAKHFLYDPSFSNLLDTCVITPIWEELLFRGILESGLRKAINLYFPNFDSHGYTTSILVSGLFGLAHYPVYDSINHVIHSSISGFFYSRAAQTKNGILVAITAHAIHNSIGYIKNIPRH
jgi:hypothetical protein